MILEMLAGGGLVIIGSGIGFIFGRVSRRNKVPKPICGCGHVLAYHNPSTGRCNEMERVEGVWDRERRRHVDKLVPCSCRQYTGPTPLPTVYAPEITG